MNKGVKKEKVNILVNCIFSGLLVKLRFFGFILEIVIWLFYRLYLRSLNAD